MNLSALRVLPQWNIWLLLRRNSNTYTFITHVSTGRDWKMKPYTISIKSWWSNTGQLKRIFSLNPWNVKHFWGSPKYDLIKGINAVIMALQQAERTPEFILCVLANGWNCFTRKKKEGPCNWNIFSKTFPLKPKSLCSLFYQKKKKKSIFFNRSNQNLQASYLCKQDNRFLERSEALKFLG